MMLLFLIAALLQAPPPQMATIDRGADSGLEMARQVVVRTEAEWAALWKLHAPGRPAPKVDFSTRMVLGVFLGTRPSAGFSVEIVGVKDERGGRVVGYVETRPGPDAITAQILTAPFHIVSVPARPGEVKFEKTEK